MATRQEIEEIRTRVGILEVVSRYVDVKPRGERYVAVCPFHPDSSPSLTISPEKGLFHCFGCGEGGDVFKFLMTIERIEFPEAVRRLAEEAGVKISGERRSDDLSRLRELIERVARHYQQRLKGPGGRQALEYLRGRGLTYETIERFRLGYAPPGGEDLLRAFKGQEAELMRLGLVMEGEGGRWSFFRRRVIFPLMSTQGGVVGFAGRTLGREEPKYLNTKNTPLFEKGRLLYGFPWARAAMSKRSEALIVEGYTDVIMAHQSGFSHAVASMGTAFTAEQALLIKRFAPRAILAYDRDVAGRAATLRGMKQLLSAGLEVWVVLLPPGEDPDELLRREGREAFAALLESALPFHEFYVQALIEEHGAVSLGGQERILAEARAFLRGLESPALKAQILRELSGSLDIPLEDLLVGMKAPQPAAIMGDRVREPSWGVEEHLMYLLVQGELPIRRAMEELSPADFHRFSHAVEVLFTLYREEGGPERLEGAWGRRFIEEWFARLDAEEGRELRELAMSERRDADSEKAASQLIGRLRLSGVERRLKSLKREIERAEQEQERKTLQRLQQEQQVCLRERQKLLRQLGWGAIAPQGGGRRDG
jgi:DNA primase